MEIYANDIVAERVLPREATDGQNARGAAAEQQAATRRMTTSRWATTFSFLVPDALAGLLVLVVANLFARLAGTGVQLSASYLGPVAVLLVGGFAVSGLYHRALTMHPVQEIRVAALVTTVVFFACGTTLWMAGAIGPGGLATLGIAWGVAALVVPLARALSRLLFAQTDWWGASVLVVASGAAGRAVVRNLRCWPEMGLRPVAVLQEYGGDGAPADGTGEEIEGVPVLHERDAGELAPRLMTAYGISYAIVSRPDLEHRALAHLLRRCSRFCRQVFVMPGLSNAPALWTGPQAFQGFLGYGVRRTERSLAARAAQFGKRIFDVVCALLILLVTAPFALILSALIKLESPGPVFFRQLRIGRKGRCFSCLKFRSMHVDADRRLEEVLESDPALRAEYEVYHKLKNDPRVTGLGAFLRQYSLDELPQLWNVLKGEMSLVGPRAYTPSELSDMQDLDRIITQNRPGLSGLWQVSGRNKLSFEERTRLDVHYIHHWSLSMDLYILARTLPVVFEKENAA